MKVLVAVKERKSGRVVNFFSRPGAAAVMIEEGNLALGDAVHFKGGVTDLYQRIDSLQIDGAAVSSATAGQTAGIRVESRVRRNDLVFKVEDRS